LAIDAWARNAWRDAFEVQFGGDDPSSDNDR
jgi:hypothetical protein